MYAVSSSRRRSARRTSGVRLSCAASASSCSACCSGEWPGTSSAAAGLRATSSALARSSAGTATYQPATSGSPSS